MLLRGLRGRGVREIRGDVVLDRAISAPRISIRRASTATRSGPTPVPTLLVNFKAIAVQFIPEPEARSVAVAGQMLDAAQIINVTITEGACGTGREAQFEPEGNTDAMRLGAPGYARMRRRARNSACLGRGSRRRYSPPVEGRRVACRRVRTGRYRPARGARQRAVCALRGRARSTKRPTT